MGKHKDGVRPPSPDAVEDDLEAKRKTFLALSLKLREKTKGRIKIPSEVLIREDRESGYRNI